MIMTRITRPIVDPAELAESIFSAARQDEWMQEGDYTSLGMLITDAILRRDRADLDVIHNGLRRLYGKFRETSARIDIGRLLGLIDITYWALRRID